MSKKPPDLEVLLAQDAPGKRDALVGGVLWGVVLAAIAGLALLNAIARAF